MENNKWTDKDEIHRIMNDAADMNNVFFELTSRIKRYDNRVGNLPPIAIYYNNKMVEIYHYFQDRKVPYAFSMESVIYSMVCCRLDIAHAMSQVSRFMAQPSREH